MKAGQTIKASYNGREYEVTIQRVLKNKVICIGIDCKNNPFVVEINK